MLKRKENNKDFFCDILFWCIGTYFEQWIWPFSPETQIIAEMQWNGVRRAHSLWFTSALATKKTCKSLTHNTHLHHAYIPVSHFVTMSSLEEPLAFDKLPSMSTIDRIQRFSSGACRPRDDVGMGHRWIEGRDCSTSNSCKSVGFINLCIPFFISFKLGLLQVEGIFHSF